MEGEVPCTVYVHVEVLVYMTGRLLFGQMDSNIHVCVMHVTPDIIVSSFPLSISLSPN